VTATTTTDPAAWARVREFDLALRARVATRAPTPHGSAFRFSEPAFWDLNFVYVERPAAPTADLVADADAAMAGLRHRMLIVDEPADVTRLAGDLARAGWTIERHMAMLAGSVPPDRTQRHPVREVPAPDVVLPRREAIREDGYDEATIAAIEVADLMVGRAMAERAFVSIAADGSVSGMAKLYTDGTVGQIEDVQTRHAHRGAGHAQAVVLAALEASRRAPHALTFLWADEDDWPREMYRRLGFSVIGRRWRFRRSVSR
jgi:ribosomal protein S18 acetylase RimI-like enzyme